MSAAPVNTTKPPVDKGPVPMPLLAALLSLCVPGLGQIVQGMVSHNFVRLSKGCLFFVAIWGMFFYGYAKSHWRNVYLPHMQENYLLEDQETGRLNKSANLFGRPLPPFLGNLWARPQYMMQFFVGLPAWPSLWNYFLPDSTVFSKIQISPGTVSSQEANPRFPRHQHWQASEAEDNRIQQENGMGRLWEIYWIYTVIAGALNIMVIYDAYAGPVKFKVVKKKPGETKK